MQTRSLASRFVLQFSFIILPLALVVVVQTVLDSWIAHDLGRSHRAQKLAYELRGNFKAFLDGVVDAVDTGALSNSAKERLGHAVKSVETLAAEESGAENLAALASKITDLATALAGASKLQDLMVLRSSINALDAEILALVSRYDARIEKDLLGSLTYASAQRKIVPLVLIITLIVTALFIRNTLTRPILQAADAANTIAAGKISPELKLNLRKDLGNLLGSIAWMNDSLYKVISAVKGAAQTVSGSSQELAAINGDIARHIERQASAIEETAANMEELTGTVKQNSDNAVSANKLAQGASNTAASARKAMTDVVAKMDNIQGSARKIVGIVAVMDDIAFQTNILALNAAVEAARAGESGRGFAVVASEVRALSLKSAAAAKEIKGLVNSAVDNVGEGHKLVQGAATTIDETVSSIQRVAMLMSDIASASKEQASGINQVKTAVEEMDRAISSSNTLVGNAVTASKQLEAQALNLAEVVEAFRLEEAEWAASGAIEDSSDATPLEDRASPFQKALPQFSKTLRS